jgi:peptidoglycan hydrolase-like protein with peptidoglycan-binding domain
MRFNEFKIIKEADGVILGPKDAVPGAPVTKDKESVMRAFRPDGTFYVEVPTSRKGTEIADVQKALIALGYPLPEHGVDGLRGPETNAAVKKFQTDNRLPGHPLEETGCSWHISIRRAHLESTKYLK